MRVDRADAVITLDSELSTVDLVPDAGLAERLRATGYTTHITPFGWFHEWDLSVHGESLAKVWKQI